ncbi:MAG: hypothetical protein H6667_08555 [Ardenticatenaceae bacterium]|nr:hypothetical protein [Ardenticatenaceae bacterium]MCB9445799.1 hypothetical protein [Ardenticatenaceae bacterium]
MHNDRTIFLTLVRTSAEKDYGRILIDSIRDFGGELSQCPIWLFEADPQNASCTSLVDEQVKIFPLGVPDSVKGYFFASKVWACAQAEAMASDVQSLIWIDPVCLVIQPPLLFELDGAVDTAVRPVHIKNVGQLPEESPDSFWQKVYNVVGLADLRMTVETFVGKQQIRAYFNTHAFAVNPAKGLLHEWFTLFEQLVRDKDYQKAACPDQLHQIFLHQAIWSALLAARLPLERVRILPPDYNYPYNLHQSVPPERRAAALNDLVCAAYEERSLDPQLMDDIAVQEPLRSWLAAQVR